MYLPRLALAALSAFSLASTTAAAAAGSADSAYGQVPFLSPEQLAQAEGQAEKHAYQVSCTLLPPGLMKRAARIS